MIHALLASPDDYLLQTARQLLGTEGYQTFETRSLSEARQALLRIQFRLVCLDSLFANSELLAFHRWLRTESNHRRVPTLLFAPKSFLLATTLLPYHLEPTFDGAVAKPPCAEELSCELTKLVGKGAPTVWRQPGRLRVGQLSLNESKREISDGSVSVRLTPTEFRLLRYLMEHPGETRSTDDLLEHVWGYPSGTAGPEIVRAHVRNLREKLRNSGIDVAVIRTLPGHGYGIAD